MMEDLPYRCPKCGNDASFPTLRHLRDHLDVKHSYQSPWVKKTVIVNGRTSPLSDSFKRQTEDLENQLKLAQETEQLHKAQRFTHKKSLFNSTDRALQDDANQTYLMFQNLSTTPLPTPVDWNYHYNSPKSAPAPPAMSPYEEYQSRLVSKPDPQVSNMLTKANEQMQTLRQATNEIIAQQRSEMDRLKEQLSLKDSQILQTNQELTKLTDESRKLQKELMAAERKQGAEKGQVETLKEQLKTKDEMITLKQEELSTLTEYLQRLSEEQTEAKKQLDSYIHDILESKHNAEKQLLDMKRSMVEGGDTADYSKMSAAPDIQGLLDSLPQHSSTRSVPYADQSYFNDPVAHSTPMTRAELYGLDDMLDDNGEDGETYIEDQPPNSMYSPGDMQANGSKRKLFGKPEKRSPRGNNNNSSVLDSGVATSFSSGGHTLDDLNTLGGGSRRRSLPQPPSYNSVPPRYNPTQQPTQQYNTTQQQCNQQANPGTTARYNHPSVTGTNNGNPKNPLRNQQQQHPQPQRRNHNNNAVGYDPSSKDTAYKLPNQQQPLHYNHHPLNYTQPHQQPNTNKTSPDKRVPIHHPLNQNRDTYNKPKLNNGPLHNHLHNPVSEPNMESIRKPRLLNSHPMPNRASKSPETSRKSTNPELKQSRSSPTWSKSAARNQNNSTNICHSWSEYHDNPYMLTKQPSSSAESGLKHRRRRKLPTPGKQHKDTRSPNNKPHTITEHPHSPPRRHYDDYADPAHYLSESEHSDSDSLAELSAQLKDNLRAFSDSDYDAYTEDEGEKIKQKQKEEKRLAKEKKQKQHPSTPGSPHRVEYTNKRGPVAALDYKEEAAMWFCVFLYLDMYHLGVTAQVCRAWRDVSRHPALWRKVELEGRRISSKYLHTISRWCSQLQSLKLNDLHPRPRLDGETLENYNKATWGYCEDGVASLLQAAGTNLRSFAVTNCSHILSDRVLWLLSCRCSLVERVAYVSDSDPVGAEVLYALGAGCRNIHTLIIPPVFPNDKPHKFTDQCCVMLARCWSALLVLNIGGVEVTHKGLTAIARHCPQLQVLELDHMAEIQEHTAAAMCRAGLKGLTTLDFTFTPPAPKAILQYHSACPLLEAIHVHIGVTDYFEDAHDPHNIQQYQTIVENLQKLKKRPGLNRVLHLRTDYN